MTGFSLRFLTQENVGPIGFSGFLRIKGQCTRCDLALYSEVALLKVAIQKPMSLTYDLTRPALHKATED